MKLFKLLLMTILLSITFTSCDTDEIIQEENSNERIMPVLFDMDKENNPIAQSNKDNEGYSHGWEFKCGNFATKEQVQVNYNYTPPEWMLWSDHNEDGVKTWQSVSGFQAYQWCRNDAVISDARQSGGCSDPNSSDWIEKKWVNGHAQFVLHTTGPAHAMLSAETEIEINISASTANGQCYEWNN